MSLVKYLVPVLVLFGLTGCSVDDPTLQGKPGLSLSDPLPEKQAVAYNENRNLLWGDLHVHTSLSYDSYGMGVRILPDDAYHYFKGGTILHGAGYKVQAKRPIDFAAVTDHAEYLGVPRHVAGENAEDNSLPEMLATGSPLRITYGWFANMIKSKNENPAAAYGDIEGLDDVMSAAWQDTIVAAERNNNPGRFTAFIAYEYTSMPGGQNLHRNVIFRGSNVTDRPFSAVDSENPEDLWFEIEKQRALGNESFAIPHNGNASNGLMYDRQKWDGSPLDAEYAKRRMINEPITEMFQAKGSSETHPELSPDDLFAGHELFTTIFNPAGDIGKVPGSYIRDAMRVGMEYSHKQGFNPYMFGVIGSGDSHNGTMLDEEDNYSGKQPIMDGSAAQRLGEVFLMSDSMRRTGQWGSQGLAAVYAQENTRDSIYDALRRKESYATTGPRMTLRFFGGWDYSAQMLHQTDWLDQAYAAGVPMGGILNEDVSDPVAPSFLLVAGKDPIGANLDRLQVIKAWVDAEGNSHEKIFDVAGSDDRMTDPVTGLLPMLKSTVDVAEATYDNTTGAAQLSAYWQDPEFSPEQQAFYYARAIEISTPRYSTYDAKALGVEAPDPAEIQERAVSSAIWYQP